MVIKLKLLFKNKTKYTREVYDSYLIFHNKKYGFTYKLYTIIIVFLILFCLILQVKYRYYNLAIIFCIGLTCFFLWRFLHPIKQVQNEYNGETLTQEKEFTFCFYEKYFTIKNKNELNKIHYYKLYKIFETSKFFYLYVDKTHSFLIDKSTFLIGNSNDFGSFLKHKNVLKYKKYLNI